MARYRKKPVVIDAWRWQPDCEQLFRELKAAGLSDLPIGTDASVLMINTLEGVMEAHPGDWIIKGIAGEFYPCKPAIFDLIYEPCEDADEVLPGFRD